MRPLTHRACAVDPEQRGALLFGRVTRGRSRKGGPSGVFGGESVRISARVPRCLGEQLRIFHGRVSHAFLGISARYELSCERLVGQSDTRVGGGVVVLRALDVDRAERWIDELRDPPAL